MITSAVVSVALCSSWWLPNSSPCVSVLQEGLAHRGQAKKPVTDALYRGECLNRPHRPSNTCSVRQTGRVVRGPSLALYCMMGGSWPDAVCRNGYLAVHFFFSAFCSLVATYWYEALPCVVQRRSPPDDMVSCERKDPHSCPPTPFAAEPPQPYRTGWPLADITHRARNRRGMDRRGR